jgi:protein gp37
MGANSKIEWTDHTFNPWIGCQKVSPGCDDCYAEALMDKRYHRVEWGPHGQRQRTSRENWRLRLRWSKQARASGVRKHVFCASLADWLDNQVPQQWRIELGELIAATPELDWLLLTKRIELFDRLAPWSRHAVPNNIWIGITCESQEYFDRRYPLLQDINAIRFISYEPALGPSIDYRSGTPRLGHLWRRERSAGALYGAGLGAQPDARMLRVRRRVLHEADDWQAADPR